MKKLVLSGKKIITGRNALEELQNLTFQRAVIVTGGSSMIRTGVIRRARQLLESNGCQVTVHSGVKSDPSFEEVTWGVALLKEVQPDAVIAIGGGSAMDCAKAMLLFYEFPFLNYENVLEKNSRGEIPTERKTALICIPSTSGTGSELTRGCVISDLKKEIKVPIMTDCLRPDLAILDSSLPQTMPSKIAAETGMDALTHAIEAYINHNLDEFDEALCSAAIEGILKWLPASCLQSDPKAREKVHYYQAMAGIGFANVGLGMVHGVAHSYGAAFHLSHGLTNAIILPYALRLNRKDKTVGQKLKTLSDRCHCEDIVEAIDALRDQLHIPRCFREVLAEEQFLAKQEQVIEHAMLGATRVNPVVITIDTMKKFVPLVYYGEERTGECL